MASKMYRSNLACRRAIRMSGLLRGKTVSVITAPNKSAPVSV